MDQLHVAAASAAAASPVIGKSVSTPSEVAPPELRLPRILEDQCARALVCAFFEQPRHLARLLHEADTLVEAPGVCCPLSNSLSLSDTGVPPSGQHRGKDIPGQTTANCGVQRSRAGPSRNPVTRAADTSQVCRRLNEENPWERTLEENCGGKSHRPHAQLSLGQAIARKDTGDGRPLIPDTERARGPHGESDCRGGRERAIGSSDARSVLPGEAFFEARKAENGKGVSDAHPLCWMLSEAERRFAQAERDIETQLQRVHEGVSKFADHVAGVYTILSGLASETDDFRDHIKARVAEWCKANTGEHPTRLSDASVLQGVPVPEAKEEQRGVATREGVFSAAGSHRASSHTPRLVDPGNTAETNGGPAGQVSVRVKEKASCLQGIDQTQAESAELQGQRGERGANRNLSCQAVDSPAAGDEGLTNDARVNAPTSVEKNEKPVGQPTPHPGGSTESEDPGAGSLLASLRSRLSAPIIPRCVRRRRWWESTRCRHRVPPCRALPDASSSSSAGGLPVGASRPLDQESETDDEGVRFEDGVVPDDYGLHSRDFFYLSDVLSPLLRDFSSPEHFHAPTGNCRPCEQDATSELTESTTSTSCGHGASTVSAPPLPRSDDAETVEKYEETLEKDGGLAALLNGGGGRLRWLPPAPLKRSAGDPRPSTRSKGAVSFGSCQNSAVPDFLPCEGENTSQSRTPHFSQCLPPGLRTFHEATKSAVPDFAPSPVLGTSCSLGFPSLLLPHRTRGPPDPTRPRPAPLDETLKSLETEAVDLERASRGRKQRTWLARRGERGGSVGRECAEAGDDSPVPVEEKGGSLGAPWGRSEGLPRQGLASPGEGQDAPFGSPVTMGATMAFPYVKGVTYSRLKKYWIAQWIEDGQAKVKYFSTYKYGEELAHKLAVDWRLSRAASTRNGRQRSAAASQTGGEPAGPVDSAAGCQEKGTPSESQQEARLNNADAEAVTEAKPRDAGAGNHRSEKFAGTRRRCGSLPHPRRAAARMTWLGGAEPCLEEGPAGARSTSGGPRGGGRGGTGSRQLTPHRNNSIVGVSFSRTGNAWLAYIKNRLTKMQVNRYFKVTVYGFKLAKKKAIEARLELEKQLRSQSGWEAFSDRKSLSAGVYFEEEKNSWVACCRDPNTGEGLYKFFSVEACPGGDEEARTKAIDARLEMDELFGEDDEHAYAQPNTEVARRKRKRKTEDGEAGGAEGEVASTTSKEIKREQQTHANSAETEKEGPEDAQLNLDCSTELPQTKRESRAQEPATKTSSQEYRTKDRSQCTAEESGAMESWKGLGRARRLRASDGVGSGRPKPKRRCIRGRWRRGPPEALGLSSEEADALGQTPETGGGAAAGGRDGLVDCAEEPARQGKTKAELESDCDGSVASAGPAGGLIGRERVKSGERTEISELSWARRNQEGGDADDGGQVCVKPEEAPSEDAAEDEESSTDRDDSCEAAPRREGLPPAGDCAEWESSQSRRTESNFESGWVNVGRGAEESPVEEAKELEGTGGMTQVAPTEACSPAGEIQRC